MEAVGPLNVESMAAALRVKSAYETNAPASSNALIRRIARRIMSVSMGSVSRWQNATVTVFAPLVRCAWVGVASPKPSAMNSDHVHLAKPALAVAVKHRANVGRIDHVLMGNYARMDDAKSHLNAITTRTAPRSPVALTLSASRPDGASAMKNALRDRSVMRSIVAVSLMLNVVATMIALTARSALGTCVVPWRAVAVTTIVRQVNSATARTISVCHAPIVLMTVTVPEANVVTKALACRPCAGMMLSVVAS